MRERFLVVRLLGLTLSLVLLLAACALPGTSSQPTSAPAAQSTSAPAATTAPANTAAPAATPAPTARATSAAASTATGNVVRLELVAGDNEARYRVREQLARVSLPSDAVGATRSVTGTIVARTDGTIITDQSKVQVDLRTLKSDEDRRDNFIKQTTLQTSRFPFATFVPTAIEGLTIPPPQGPVEFKLTGNMTIRDVTKPVTWTVKGRIEGNEAIGTATTSFTWDYFNLNKPNVAVVLSVEDTVKLEMDLHLRRVN